MSRYRAGHLLVTSSAEDVKRRVQENSRQVLEDAGNGSIADILVLADNFDNLPQTMRFFKDSFTMFISHLRRIKPSMDTGTAQEDIVEASLYGIVMFGFQLFNPYNEDVVEFVVKSGWPSIYQWMRYFYVMDVLGSRGSSERKQEVIALISEVLNIMNHCGPCFEGILRDDPNIVRLIVQLWLQEDTEVDQALASKALVSCKFAPDDERRRLRIIQEVESDGDFIVELALTRLQEAARQDPINSDAVLAYVEVLTLLCSKSRHSYRELVLKKRGVEHVVQALDSLARVPSRPEMDAFMAAEACMVFLDNHVECSQGLFRMKQALRDGFLHSLVYFAPSFPFFLINEDVSRNIVSGLLPRYLVFRLYIESTHFTLFDLSPALLNKSIRFSKV